MHAYCTHTAYLHTCIPTYLHIPACTCKYLHTYIHKLHNYIPTYLHNYLPTYLPTCIHACINIGIYTCKQTYVIQTYDVRRYEDMYVRLRDLAMQGTLALAGLAQAETRLARLNSKTRTTWTWQRTQLLREHSSTTCTARSPHLFGRECAGQR